MTPASPKGSAAAPSYASASRWSDYSTVTETPGDRITREAASMLVSRYHLSATHCRGARVLEVACGSGQGLGYLKAHARLVIGGDITELLLQRAREHYRQQIPLVRLDAERLPFPVGAFDVLLLHEALYYLPSFSRFVDEAFRVLAPGGRLVLSTVNPEWPDFNPSPFATKYLRAGELRQAIGARFRDVTIMAGFPLRSPTARDRFVSALKRAAIRAGLMPRTMRRKRFLKRLFLGELLPVPAEITPTIAAVYVPVTVDAAVPLPSYKVLYAIGTR